jgi:hypothetical protein
MTPDQTAAEEAVRAVAGALPGEVELPGALVSAAASVVLGLVAGLKQTVLRGAALQAQAAADAIVTNEDATKRLSR